MLNNLFQSTTIPVMEQVVNFTEARHNVLAGNIANIDTPGYHARDLSVDDFQNRLNQAIESQRGAAAQRSPGEPAAPGVIELSEVSEKSATVLHHDQSNVSMEQQVSEMVKNQIQHNMALTIMNNQFKMLKIAISERL